MNGHFFGSFLEIYQGHNNVKVLIYFVEYFFWWNCTLRTNMCTRNHNAILKSIYIWFQILFNFAVSAPLGRKAICWEMDYVKIGLRPDWIKLKYVWAIVISYWGKSLQRYLASTNNLFLSSIMFNQIAHPFWKVNFYNYQIDLTDITKKLVKIYEYLE